MTLNQFIFSNTTSHRIVRHLVFWILYCSYFYVQSLAPRKLGEFFIWETYYFAFLNLCCFGPVFIFAVYFFIYYLLPKTVYKKKYIFFITGFLLVYVLGTFVNYFMAGIFLNSVHYSTPVEPDFQHRMEFGNYNTRWAMIIATIAFGIKLSKGWYLQQKENLEITRKKNKVEMQLQKARIHPELLLRSLDTIYTNIQSGSEKAATLILNLSDLLSYSLYESDTALIPLEKELSELQHLIALEKQNKESSIEIHMKTAGKTQGKFMPPMVIVKLFDESITILHNNDTIPQLLHSEIIVVNDHLSVNLKFSGSPEKPLTNVNWSFVIKNTRQRLNEFYSETDYQIELTNEKDTIEIGLYMKLGNNPGQITVFPVSKLTSIAHDTA